MTTEPKDARGGDFRPCENEPKASDPPPVREAVDDAVLSAMRQYVSISRSLRPAMQAYIVREATDAILALTGETSRE